MNKTEKKTLKRKHPGGEDDSSSPKCELPFLPDDVIRVIIQHLRLRDRLRLEILSWQWNLLLKESWHKVRNVSIKRYTSSDLGRGLTIQKAKSLWRRAAPRLESLSPEFKGRSKHHSPEISTFVAFKTLINFHPNCLTEIHFGENLVGKGLVNLLCQIGNQLTSLELKRFAPAAVAEQELFHHTPNLKKLIITLQKDCGCLKQLPRSLEKLELRRSHRINGGGQIPEFAGTDGAFGNLLELKFVGPCGRRGGQTDYQNILKVAPNVEVLRLQDCRDMDFGAITACTPGLRELHLDNTVNYCCSLVNHLCSAVHESGAWGDHMEVLHANHINLYHKCSLDFLWRMPNLRELSLAGTYKCVKDIEEIAECKKLEKLLLGDSKDMTDEGLISLGQNCPSLKYLDVSRCKRLTLNGIEGMLAGISEPDKLQLDVRGIGLNKENLKHLMDVYGFSLVKTK